MRNSQHFDEMDKIILDILKKDARTPFLEIARKCNVSGAAIHQRVNRLTKNGLITKPQYLLNPDSLGYSTCAFMGIYLESANMYKSAIEELRKIPEITESYYTTGNYSIFVKIYSKTNNHLKEVMTEQIQSLPGIIRTETFIVLEENFKRQLPVD